MSSFGYDTSTLRVGGRHADDAAASAASARDALAAAIPGSPFGTVAAAAGLHSAVGQARAVEADAAHRACAELTDAARRLRGAAALGDANTTATAYVATGAAR